MHADADFAAVQETCLQAVSAGRSLLLAGKSALDAVEAAVRVLEDAPVFNAGYGAVLNAEGVAEMDALVMEGAKHRVGALGAVRRIKNPVSAARLVMERSPHHLLVGEGAEQFAAAQGVTLVQPESMIAPNRLNDPFNEGGDTVGAVALDAEGHIAVAVSTGGIRGKLPGRVGDSPLPGAGAWADDPLGGACSTGWGETIIRSLLSVRAVDLLATHPTAQSAADAVMPIFARYDGDGGLIMVDKAGGVGFAHNTPLMPVAWFEGEMLHVVMRRS